MATLGAAVHTSTLSPTPSPDLSPIPIIFCRRLSDESMIPHATFPPRPMASLGHPGKLHHFFLLPSWSGSHVYSPPYFTTAVFTLSGSHLYSPHFSTAEFTWSTATFILLRILERPVHEIFLPLSTRTGIIPIKREVFVHLIDWIFCSCVNDCGENPALITTPHTLGKWGVLLLVTWQDISVTSHLSMRFECVAHRRIQHKIGSYRFTVRFECVARRRVQYEIDSYYFTVRSECIARRLIQD